MKEPQDRFGFIRSTVAAIREQRAMEPIKRHSDLLTEGLDEVIAEECARGMEWTARAARKPREIG